MDAEVENDAGPGFAGPGEKRLVVALDEADGAVNDVPAVTAGEDADAVEEGGEIAAGDVEFGDHFAARTGGAGAGIDAGMIAFGIMSELVGVGPIDLIVGGEVVIAINVVSALFVGVSEKKELFPILGTKGGGTGSGNFAGGGFISGEDAATEEVIGFWIDGELEIAVERAASDGGIEFCDEILGGGDFDAAPESLARDELQRDGVNDAKKAVATDDEAEEVGIFVAAATN